MKQAIVLDSNDIKKIIAEKFGVPEEEEDGNEEA